MGEQDPDVVRWGLNFLDVDEMFSPNYYDDNNNQQNVNISHEQYTSGHNQNSEFNNIENDEFIAHSLQRELLQMSVSEGNDSKKLQKSSGTQNWYGPLTGTYYYDDQDGMREGDDAGPSSLYSSPGDRTYDGEEYSYDLEITDELDLDGEVVKRLNEITPTAHIPKTNGDIPSFDEATSDHQRLIDRLQLYNLVESKVQGDGNCQFRALSDQFYRSPEHHEFVREQVVNQLKSHPDLYEGYVPMLYSDYLKNMSMNGEWGDHVTLQAATDSYGIKIFVITSFKDTCWIEIVPKIQKSKRVIFLSFWAEVHYNSIYPEGELPALDFKKKKRWWKFGHKH